MGYICRVYIDKKKKSIYVSFLIYFRHKKKDKKSGNEVT